MTFNYALFETTVVHLLQGLPSLPPQKATPLIMSYISKLLLNCPLLIRGDCKKVGLIRGETIVCNTLIYIKLK